MQRFGTFRGIVRLALSYPQSAFAGELLPAYDRAAIRRLVFVCHGNICRSAYGDMLARQLGANVASFGLSTSTGSPAHPPIAAIAEAQGLDAASHRTSQRGDEEPLPGDLLLAMEMRHVAALAADARWGDTPRALLGSFLRPPVPHLHDPYKLSPAYMEICLARIDRATRAVVAAHPGVVSVSERP